MPSARKDDSNILEINASKQTIYSVLFTEDGKTVFGGGIDGELRRWQVNSGQEVGEPIKVEKGEIYAATLSPDGKWLACGIRYPEGTSEGGSNLKVWDMHTHENVLDIHGHTNSVFSVDISSDSTRVASGSFDQQAFIWDITTGERLVGPLEHDDVVICVRFSPNGDRIATVASEDVNKGSKVRSICVYDSVSGQKLLDIPFKTQGQYSVAPFAWTIDGRLVAAGCSEAQYFDGSSGTPLGKWTIPGGRPTFVALSHNQKFLAIASYRLLSFWDASSHKQIGSTIQFTSGIWSMAFSPDDEYIMTGEQSGKIALRNLRSNYPGLYFSVKIPLMQISEAVCKSWTNGDLKHAEKLLVKEISQLSNPFHKACSLAYRSLVRARLKQWKMAIDDATESLEVQQSAIGHIAYAFSRIGNGEAELAIRQFDLMFADCLPTEIKFLLLIKAIILFECGKHDEAVLRVEDLMRRADDKSLYTTVQARMFFTIGSISMRKGDNMGAIELFKRAQKAIPFQQNSHLVTISLIFGWDFERLSLAIQLSLWKAMQAMGDAGVSNSLSTMREALGEDALTSEVASDWDPELIQKCAMAFEKNGDAVQLDDPKEAIARYSIALSLNPLNAANLFVKRSKGKVKLGLWEDALKDSDEAIKADPANPWGYERRHAALHGLQRFDDAISAFTRMLSLIEESPDEETRQSLKKYVSPVQSYAAIDVIAHGIVKLCPLVLIDVQRGCLCNAPERNDTFKKESEFQELVSSMTAKLDDELIRKVVAKYFEYVTLSHVWGGKEPLFQDVTSVNSVWNMESSPLNDKLRRFCEVVRDNGYRWAWSDTCCIDKTISTVLNQSLTMMYKWYQSCAATFIFLADVDSPSAPGALTNSIWLTRAWAAQELLAPKVIRFHDRDWKPYLGDMRSNHKESPEIMQELANAIGISRETIISFNPDDLSILEKLRLASTRNATVEEDVAYSLMGIFKSDIIPRYGEGDAALGHLLEEIVARSSDVMVLSWTGKSSSYNSCLPASLSMYRRMSHASLPIIDAELESRVMALRESLSEREAMLLYRQITRLPPVRFSNRRLYLPCIIFSVKRLGVRNLGQGDEMHYRARVSGIGHVEFQTSDKLSLVEPRKFVFVHPWIRALRDPFDGFGLGTMSNDGSGSESDSDGNGSDASPSSPFPPPPVTQIGGYTRALRLMVRLQQPFHALLLEQQLSGEFKRVAAKNHILIPGLERRYLDDIRTEVVEIL